MNNLINGIENIELNNGEKYTCFANLDLNGKHYIYLVQPDEPFKICFAEQIIQNDELEIRVVTSRQEKAEVLEAFQKALEEAQQQIKKENP